MKCSVCSKEMVTEDLGGVAVDVCKNGCKSMWFDWLELGKLDERNEGFGNALKEALQYPRYNEASRPALMCPKCGIKMFAHKYKSAKEVNVDECYKCGGFFLDSGELQVIRENFMTPEEEKAYMDKIVAEMPAYQNAELDLSKDKVRAEATRRYTRFLRVSYYLTGK